MYQYICDEFDLSCVKIAFGIEQQTGRSWIKIQSADDLIDNQFSYTPLRQTTDDFETSFNRGCLRSEEMRQIKYRQRGIRVQPHNTFNNNIINGKRRRTTIPTGVIIKDDNKCHTIGSIQVK